MKKSILFFFLLISITFYSQEKVYFTEDFKEVPSAENAVYYSTYEEVEKGTQRTTYFLDGTKRNSDLFSNYRKRMKEGTSIEWHKNGNKAREVQYIKNKIEGVTTSYYENGTIKRTENFKNGDFVNGKCFDESGNEIAFFPYRKEAQFPGGPKEFYTYIAKNFRQPNSSQGEIIIGFNVELDGSLNHFEIIKSINKEMDLAAIKVLANGPKWVPAQIDGKDTVQKLKIPITVKYN
ncbi:MAG: energy transducer TonB [Flavobacteriaceae bacterium]|nr:energy transducer TonB [Flavobacteriaceae bacterium]